MIMILSPISVLLDSVNCGGSGVDVTSALWPSTSSPELRVLTVYSSNPSLTMCEIR